MVIVLGSAVAREGSLAEALALSRAHVMRSRSEPGCLSHAVYQDDERPSRLVFVEQWSSADALRQHFKVAESRAFVGALAALCSEAPDMALYEAARLPLPGRSAA